MPGADVQILAIARERQGHVLIRAEDGARFRRNPQFAVLADRNVLERPLEEVLKRTHLPEIRLHRQERNREHAA